MSFLRNLFFWSRRPRPAQPTRPIHTMPGGKTPPGAPVHTMPIVHPGLGGKPPAPIKWQRALIDTKDYDPGEPWRANADVVIARFRVPEDSAFVIRPGSRLEFYLRNRATHAGQDNSAGATPASVTVNTPGILQTRMATPAFPTDRHPEVLAYAQIAPSTDWTRVSVQAVDYAAQTVTLSVPAGENWTAIEVYYIGAQGEFKFYVVREGGGIRDWIPIYNSSFAAIHSLNQLSDEEQPTIGNSALLVEGFQLALEINSPYEVVWNDRARHFVQVDAMAIHVAGADKEALTRRAQLLMTGGL